MCYRKEGSRNSRKGKGPKAPGIRGGPVQDVSLIGHWEGPRGTSKYMHERESSWRAVVHGVTELDMNE